MKQAIKATLLSGLVFPGLGQIALKSYARGLAFLAVALACAISLVKTTVNAVMTSMAMLEQGASNTATQAQAEGSGVALWVFALCWLLSLLDAYRLGADKDRKA